MAQPCHDAASSPAALGNAEEVCATRDGRNDEDMQHNSVQEKRNNLDASASHETQRLLSTSLQDTTELNEAQEPKKGEAILANIYYRT